MLITCENISKSYTDKILLDNQTITISDNDKIGIIFFTNKIEKFIPPKKGKKHILFIIRELLNMEPSNIRNFLQYQELPIKDSILISIIL